MKKFLGLSALLLAAACGTGDASNEPSVATAVQASGSGPVIATLQPGGNIIVNTSVLRQTFPGGGPITHFEVRELATGPNLVRSGYTPNGHARTDSFRLQKVQLNYYLLSMISQQVMVCLGGCRHCGIRYNALSCECSNGSDCDTGFIDIDPTDILDPIGP